MFVRAAIAALLFVPSLTWAGPKEIQFRCTGSSLEDCQKRVQVELEKQNCGMIPETASCAVPADSSGSIYCTAQTEYCGGTTSDGFIGVLCHSGQKVAIQDRKLTAPWARTILFIWVREMCKESSN